MGQKKRILVAIAILVVLVVAVLGIDLLRRSSGEPELAPGSIPIYLDGELVGGFAPADLEELEKVSFTDAEEGKLQEGWLLRDVIGLHVKGSKLKAGSLITVSSGETKSVELTWAEVDDPANWVMFDLSNRGTLKLVSVLDRLDTRNEWVQNVDRIEIVNP
jgi:hypothetical protein